MPVIIISGVIVDWVKFWCVYFFAFSGRWHFRPIINQGQNIPKYSIFLGIKKCFTKKGQFLQSLKFVDHEKYTLILQQLNAQFMKIQRPTIINKFTVCLHSMFTQYVYTAWAQTFKASVHTSSWWLRLILGM